MGGNQGYFFVGGKVVSRKFMGHGEQGSPS